MIDSTRRPKLRWAPLAFCCVWLGSCGGSGSDDAPAPGVTLPPPAAPPPVAQQTCLPDVPHITSRATVDRPDDTTGAKLHLVYALPADAVDEQLDINGQLVNEMKVAQRWLQEQTGRCIGMDTFEGALDVTFVRFSRTNQALRDAPQFVDQTVKLEFEARGLDDPDKVYVVYYGGSTDNGGCGGAAAIGGPAMQFLSQQTAPDGPLTRCPSFGFVDGPLGRFRGTWSGVAIHEAMHSLGVVASCAPDHDDVHPMHLETISSDLMAFDGTGFNRYTLDANRTEYYGHSNTACLDVADSAVWSDAAAGAVPLPGRVAYSQPERLDCADETAAPSAGTSVAVLLRLANVTDKPALFYRLDAVGVRESPVSVPAFSSLEQTASDADVYVATDANSGECIGVFRLGTGNNRILLVD